MKFKKITALIVSAVALIASFSAVPTATLKASAASSDIQLVQAYDEYSNTYVTERFTETYGLTFDSEKSYSFRFRAQGATEWSEGASTKSGKTTFEIPAGVAEMQFYYTEGEGENASEVLVEANGVNTFEFELVTEVTEGSIRYANLNDVALANYAASIKTKYETKVVGDSFYYPSFEDVVIVNDDASTEDVNEEVKANVLVSDHFDYSDLTKTLYYCRPGSTSFASTTSSSFSLNGIGTYSYYVLVKDPTGNAMEIDTEVHTRKVINGIDGWYDESDNLYAPIFTFTFENVKNIAITVDSSTQGFVGLTYKDVDEAITIVGDNETPEYKLYYSETNLSTNVENWNSAGIAIVEESATDVTEVEEYEFSTSTRYFKPVKKGYYYVVVRAADESGEDKAVTNAISVQKEFKAVKYETEFFKNNLFSIICLGIAALLLVAIIVVFFFYKPKEETAEESVEPVSKK